MSEKLTGVEVNKTVTGFEMVYNRLQEKKVCDQLFKVIESVSAPQIIPDDASVADPAKGEFVARYEITASCRGCTDLSIFTNDGSVSNRELRESPVPFDVRDRNLETCTCSRFAEKRSLVSRDFVSGYQKWIDRNRMSGELPNVNRLLSASEIVGSGGTSSQLALQNNASCDIFFTGVNVVVLHAFLTIYFVRKIF